MQPDIDQEIDLRNGCLARGRWLESEMKPHPNRIRELAHERGLTYAYIGKAMCPPAHRNTIGKLATGEQHLTHEWMKRIAAVLGVTPAEIIQELGPQRPIIINYVLLYSSPQSSQICPGYVYKFGTG